LPDNIYLLVKVTPEEVLNASQQALVQAASSKNSSSTSTTSTVNEDSTSSGFRITERLALGAIRESLIALYGRTGYDSFSWSVVRVDPEACTLNLMCAARCYTAFRAAITLITRYGTNRARFDVLRVGPTLTEIVGDDSISLEGAMRVTE